MSDRLRSALKQKSALKKAARAKESSNLVRNNNHFNLGSVMNTNPTDGQPIFAGNTDADLDSTLMENSFVDSHPSDSINFDIADNEMKFQRQFILALLLRLFLLLPSLCSLPRQLLLVVRSSHGIVVWWFPIIQTMLVPP
jgi:hypothetical protein